MSRPVAEWQWTDDPRVFWLRMEHLPPDRGDLVKETYPPYEGRPAKRPLEHQRSISKRQLDDCLDETFARRKSKQTPTTTACTCGNNHNTKEN